MQSETVNTKSKTKKTTPTVDMWQQTVAEYIVENLETAPVSGDTVAINNDWSLVVKDVDEKGAFRTIGLKYK